MAVESHITTKEKDDMINMLLSGINIAEIARQCNGTRATIYAWKKEPIIVAELERRREQLKKSAQDKIISNVDKCIDNMYQMANQNSDQRVRYQANKLIIEMALGKATTTVANGNDSNVGDADNNNTNDLKKEIDNIRELKVVE